MTASATFKKNKQLSLQNGFQYARDKKYKIQSEGCLWVSQIYASDIVTYIYQPKDVQNSFKYPLHTTSYGSGPLRVLVEVWFWTMQHIKHQCVSALHFVRQKMYDSCCHNDWMCKSPDVQAVLSSFW